MSRPKGIHHSYEEAAEYGIVYVIKKLVKPIYRKMKEL